MCYIEKFKQFSPVWLTDQLTPTILLLPSPFSSTVICLFGAQLPVLRSLQHKLPFLKEKKLQHQY